MILKKLEDILIKRLTLGGLTPGELEPGEYYLVQNTNALGMSTWFQDCWGWDILSKNLVYKYIRLSEGTKHTGLSSFIIYDMEGHLINEIPSPNINKGFWFLKEKFWNE